MFFTRVRISPRLDNASGNSERRNIKIYETTRYGPDY
jgi:hypothetical protein